MSRGGGGGWDREGIISGGSELERRLVLDSPLLHVGTEVAGKKTPPLHVVLQQPPCSFTRLCQKKSRMIERKEIMTENTWVRHTLEEKVSLYAFLPFVFPCWMSWTFWIFLFFLMPCVIKSYQLRTCFNYYSRVFAFSGVCLSNSWTVRTLKSTNN